MLPATQEEIDHVNGYMVSQAPDVKVQFVQKMCSERRCTASWCAASCSAIC
jgi:hypothetical protein